MKQLRMKLLPGEDAVSPVIGVMLMLVVTIIIAAVVSGFAGGLASTTQEAPSVSIETKIVNTGLWQGSGMRMHVKSVSEPIPTKDVKLVTSWMAPDGKRITTTTLPNTENTRFGNKTGAPADDFGYKLISPIGFGPGVEEWNLYQIIEPDQHFGNYTLMAGTMMRAYPVGPFAYSKDYHGNRLGITAAEYAEGKGGYGPAAKTYEYASGTGNPLPALGGRFYTIGEIDPMQAVLGENWNDLRPGDVVNVKVIHIPSGKTIYEKDVNVEGY